MSGPAEKSVAEAKYLLESLYDDSSPRDKPPTTFADRQSYEAFEQIVQNKRQRRGFDRNDGNLPDKDTKPPNPNPNFKVIRCRCDTSYRKALSKIYVESTETT